MGCGGSTGSKEESPKKTHNKTGPRTPTEAERQENRKHRLKSRLAWKTEEVQGEEGLPKDPLERAKKKGKVVPEVREAMDSYEWAEGSSPRHGGPNGSGKPDQPFAGVAPPKDDKEADKEAPAPRLLAAPSN
eukprot:Hpha_TRINITY_DN16213_c0_g1::TRINITY_DN16213_c0_g1_i1::g.13141::m.13141